MGKKTGKSPRSPTGGLTSSRVGTFRTFQLRPIPHSRPREASGTRARRERVRWRASRKSCAATGGLARAPRVRRAAPRDSRPFPRRAASVPPPGATRRGWGDTDGRFSRLDRRGEERRDDRGDAGRNISFQELRKRQDREQRKVSTPSSRRRPCVLIYPLGALSRVRARSHVRRSPSRSPADRSSSRIPP